LNANTDYSFWVRWYEALLKGSPTFPDTLLRDIALIDQEDWEKGEVHINNVRVPQLVAKYAVPNAQRGERIERDTTGEFYAQPVTGLPSDLLSEALDRIAEGIAEFRDKAKTRNILSILSGEVEQIEAAVERTKDRPLRLYEKLADAALTFVAKAAAAGLDSDADVAILLRELERSRRDIRAGDEVIEARFRGRVRVGYDELTEDQQDTWRGAIAAGAEASEPGLKSEIEDDLPIIADPDQPKEIRERAIEREAERTIQMREHIREGADDVTKLGKAFGAATQVLNQIMGWFT